MAKSRKNGDYEGWITRLVKDVEDITDLYWLVDWLIFARDKIHDYHGYSITDDQITALADAHNNGDVWANVEEKVGVSIERPFRTKSQIVLRDLTTGRFVSRDKVNAKTKGG